MDEMVVSATGKQVQRGQIPDRAPEIRFEELEFHEKIGKGCFGSVFKGKCRGISVAIKQLNKQNLDPKTMEEFRKEVDILTQMRHPNVVLFLGACTEPGKMAIVCELLKDNVQNLLRTHKNMNLQKRLHLAKGTAYGMAWLHGANPQIIHRDLKPANLLVDEHWVVKVCDFGLSQIKLEGTAIRDGKNIPGTPLWMAPEVLLGKEVGAKADVYSYGLVLWEIITGEDLFPEMDSFGTFKKAITVQNLRPPIPPTVNPSLSQLMKQCWDSDPNKRPTFVQISQIIDGVIIDCLISDPLANKFWKQHFLEYDHVLWGSFLTHFSSLLGITKSNIKELNFACLKRILCSPNLEPNARDPDIVTLEKFSHLINWFGPINLNNNFNILDQIRVLMKQDYFHGDITKEEAEELLAGQEPGTFLLRTSTTEADKPFTISKVTGDGKINHQRITKKDGVLQLKLVYKDNTSRVATCSSTSKENSIKYFIKSLQKDLGLTKPCPGSKYKTLFISNFDTKIAKGYVVDNSDE